MLTELLARANPVLVCGKVILASSRTEENSS